MFLRIHKLQNPIKLQQYHFQSIKMKIAQISNTNKISRVSTNKAKDYFFLVHLIMMIYKNDIFFLQKIIFF